ncbi:MULTISPECIES: DUF4238 domain-containing protein [unclassified Olleya]|jgi:hypothetical protein|uniref:DUF4238 domain-containing protein n=1 Tax=unclassified Olleya TaxID=2615019 RepID=UPI0011A9A565|nr:DUF4238 domain-containing protein [Olleya sp. Hel_I_94]TVZ49861.1 uncharacterized protein DUF4238 [Olleya sp. Hel_I_94]
MITEKKNQHYIPKFYLRNFSYYKNKKQIGVYNLKSSFFIQTAKLKTQGSKNFFYGHDGVIEDKLSFIETYLAKSINTIISEEKLPLPKSEEYYFLLNFITLTNLRSPTSLDTIKQMSNSMKSKLNSLDPSFIDGNQLGNIKDEDLIRLLLSMSAETLLIITDLKAKLIINNTKTAFISSDFPIIKYNQFLEKRKVGFSKTGYGLIGLQILCPISEKLAVILYDDNIYKVGNKRDKNLIIEKEKDIDSINLLQFINNGNTIFFTEKTSKTYLDKIHNKSKKFKKANQGIAELSYIIKEGENPEEVMKNKENLIITGATDCETNLELEGLKIHSKGKAIRHIKHNQLRKHPEFLIRMKKN